METGLLLPPDSWNHHHCHGDALQNILFHGHSLFIYIFLNFIYFWLHRVFTVARAFSGWDEQGLLSSWGVQASHCGGSSCCRAWVLGTRASIAMVHRLNCSAAKRVWSLGWEGPPGEGNGNPLHCSCLGNPMDQGTWWDTAGHAHANQGRPTLIHCTVREVLLCLSLRRLCSEI